MSQRNLKIAVIEAGLKQRDIADRLGVQAQQVSKWVKRKRQVPDSLKREFATMIGVSLDDLLPPDAAQ